MWYATFGTNVNLGCYCRLQKCYMLTYPGDWADKSSILHLTQSILSASAPKSNKYTPQAIHKSLFQQFLKEQTAFNWQSTAAGEQEQLTNELQTKGHLSSELLPPFAHVRKQSRLKFESNGLTIYSFQKPQKLEPRVQEYKPSHFVPLKSGITSNPQQNCWNSRNDCTEWTATWCCGQIGEYLNKASM